MLNRRHLRVKVMHSLYAFFQSKNTDLRAGEKELLFSLEKVYDLYIYYLSLLPEIAEVALNITEDAKQKYFPTEEERNPNKKFIENFAIQKLASNQPLHQMISKRKINWKTEPEMIKKMYNQVKASPEYQEYMSTPSGNIEEDKEFLVKIFKNYIGPEDLLIHLFEEKSIYWMDDFDLVASMVIKTIRNISQKSGPNDPLIALYKDEEDDRNFAIDLFRKTIIKSDEYEKMIAEKTENWEVDRIAMMDVLLMKMALAEMLNFPNIPVKVTLNEYIELSKNYSTPKSKMFINGILDKLVMSLKEKNLITKVGRGLME